MIHHLKQKKFFSPEFFLFLLAIFLFWKKGVVSLDPDFGWHLKMGEIIASTGIPKTDPFSYTMPSFPFVDHEWLTNVIIYKLDSPFGQKGLAFLYSILAVLSLIVAGSGIKRNGQTEVFRFSLFILAIGTVLPFSGLRPQVLSWLFLAIFLKVILDEGVFRKYFYLLPLFMVIWANLHGSFAVGIFCLGMVLGLRILRTRELHWQEIFGFILCLAATFINPYGWRLWGEVWQQVSDSALRWRIVEWGPSLFVPIFPYLILVSLGYLVYVSRKRVAWEKLGLYLFFLVQSLLGLRFIPLFIIVCLPIYLETVNYLREQISAIEFGKLRWQKAEIFLLSLCLLVTVMQTGFFVASINSLSEGNFYPTKAVSFLEQNLPEGNLLSTYNWGGYLIWKLPEKKVFIDGRMPSWRRKGNFLNESSNAMNDYMKMQENEGEFENQLMKYNVTVVHWQKEKEGKDLVRLIKNLFWKSKSSEKRFVPADYLKREGWQLLYQDSLSVIYSKE